MAGSRANQKQAGGQNERFRKYRISHFRLQARRERNCRRGFLGTFRGVGEGRFSALSIRCSGGWHLSTVRWDVHRGRRKADLES
jgi:hypothetical protein